jgi:hypothetical protein
MDRTMEEDISDSEALWDKLFGGFSSAIIEQSNL